jgi:hypothetical protein
MKKLILSFCFLGASQFLTSFSSAQALEKSSQFETPSTRTETVFGNSTSFGFCGGANGYFCIDQLKMQAERDAGYQVNMSCQADRGQLQGFAYCSTNCFPFYIPPNAPMQSANCSAQCNQTCIISTP